MGFQSGLAPNAVKTALDMVFMSEYEYPVLPGTATAETAGIFRQDSTDKAAVIVEQFQGVGYFGTRAENENVPEGTARVGNQKTFSVLNYSKAVPISKNLFDDDQHSVVDKMMTDCGRLARISRDKNAFNVLNLGFTTQTTNDGVAIFSNSHTTLGGDTVDNLETGVLNEANLNSLILSLMAQKTQDGTLGGFEPAVLLVPDILFKAANEITKSELRSGTANNDLNYFSNLFPGLQVMRSSFLNAAQGGSATAHFLLSRNASLFRWVRQALQTELVDWKISPKNEYVYKGEYREVVGAISYEGLCASNGTV